MGIDTTSHNQIVEYFAELIGEKVFIAVGDNINTFIDCTVEGVDGPMIVIKKNFGDNELIGIPYWSVKAIKCKNVTEVNKFRDSIARRLNKK